MTAPITGRRKASIYQRKAIAATPLSGSEPPKGGLSVRQSRGTVTVAHGCQHGPNVRHRSIQFIRNRAVNNRDVGPFDGLKVGSDISTISARHA